MPKHIILPIKTHVKKFIVKELGGEPLVAKQNNIAGRQLLTMIYKKSESRLEPPEDMSEISVELSCDLAIHRHKIEEHAFEGKLYEDYFKIALVFFVNGLAPFLGSRKLAIETFFDQYDITELELKTDTALRMFHNRNNPIAFPRKVYRNDMMVRLSHKLSEQKEVIQCQREVITSLSKAVNSASKLI